MTVDTSRIADILSRNGFVSHTEHPAYDNVEALSHNGPYEVHAAWQKGDTIVHIEQNTGPETFQTPDGQEVTVTDYKFTPVLVIQNTVSGGSFAVSFHDLDAFERVLSGDVDFNQNSE